MRPVKTVTAVLLLAASSALAAAPEELYLKHCASCHHEQRYGLSGPPLVPEYFGNKKKDEIGRIISEGLPATNMPAFKGALTVEEIKGIASYITSPAAVPQWGREEMLSTWQLSLFSDEGKKPAYDMTNFFMIVEGGAGKVHFMDGDTFTLLSSVKAGAIHGGPKFDKDLRYAYIASRDGWVIKYDLVNLHETGRIRAGISSRNLAVSSDSARIAVATVMPEAVVVMDSLTMKPVKTVSNGSFGSVYNLRGRHEFIAALKDRPELLLIREDSLDARKIPIERPFTDFFIEPSERYIIGTSREGDSISVVDLDAGKVVKTVAGARMPHLASAAVWSDGKKTYAAFPHIGKPVVSVLELYAWEMKKEIAVKGPGFFARTHENLPHVWVDTGTDTVQLIDKATLEVVSEVTPEKGRKAMHVEFTKDGGYALISVWEDDGAVAVYDSRTLKFITSMPFKKPVGKYNATNKKY